jgi:hypothetical protein
MYYIALGIYRFFSPLKAKGFNRRHNLACTAECISKCDFCDPEARAAAK